MPGLIGVTACPREPANTDSAASMYSPTAALPSRLGTQISSQRDSIRNLAAWRRISRKMIAADRYRPRQPIKNFGVLLEGGTHPLLARTSWWWTQSCQTGLGYADSLFSAQNRDFFSSRQCAVNLARLEMDAFSRRLICVARKW